MKHDPVKTRRRKTKIDRSQHALTWALWPQTSSALLEILRADISLHLDWVKRDLAQIEPDKVPKEMQRAADRLKVIEELLPAASVVIQLPVHGPPQIRRT
jgi:hypothetical protein